MFLDKNMWLFLNDVENQLSGYVGMIDKRYENKAVSYLESVDGIGCHPPNFQRCVLINFQGGIIRVFGKQTIGVPGFYQTFDSQFAIDYGDDNIAAGRLKGSINNKDVIVVDTSTRH